MEEDFLEGLENAEVDGGDELEAEPDDDVDVGGFRHFR